MSWKANGVLIEKAAITYNLIIKFEYFAKRIYVYPWSSVSAIMFGF